MDQDRHWDDVYKKKSPEEMSWYEPHLATSLEWVLETSPSPSTSIIDVGGGASRLANDLHVRGFCCLTALDISPATIAHSQKRFGTAAREIDWIIGDATRCSLPDAGFDIWHDRAVFHFMTNQQERASYVKQLAKALKPGGQIIIATFSVNGPRTCSGLAVSRYDAQSLQNELGEGFRLEKSAAIPHQTPTGAVQEFLYSRLTRLGGTDEK